MKELIICLLGWTSVAAYAAFEFWWIRRQSANANKLEAKESFWNYSSAMPPLSLAIVWLSLVFSQLRLEQNPEVGATFRQEKQTWSDLFDCIELLNMTVRECIPIGLVFLSFYKVAYLYDYRQEKSNHCESDSRLPCSEEQYRLDASSSCLVLDLRLVRLPRRNIHLVRCPSVARTSSDPCIQVHSVPLKTISIG